MQGKNGLTYLVLLLFFISIASLDSVQATGSVGQGGQDDCPDVEGNSTKDRVGCLDSDGDGYSNPDSNWTVADGADVWVDDARLWSDLDGDGFADQPGTSLSDDCPFTKGKSRVILKGCSDIDKDFVPDMYDDDADGDGIRNEMERAASSGTQLFDPYSAKSTPSDVDMDTIPDVLDDDNDNDGWPDDVELDRKSDHLNPDETPFNMYMGVNTGFIYMGGFSMTTEYEPKGMELSLSGLREVVTEELVIPFLLIPVYLMLHYVRRRQFLEYEELVLSTDDPEELSALEVEVNDLIRRRRMKLWHGLVLRNAIEERENEMHDVVLKNTDASDGWTVESNSKTWDALPSVTCEEE